MSYEVATREELVMIVTLDEHNFMEDLYKNTANLMERIYTQTEETLDLISAQECVREILQSVEKQGSFAKLMEIISQHYTTYEHSAHVAFYAALISTKIGLEMSSREKLTFAALFHDIGKLKIDHKILDKASLLSDDEFEQVKFHPEYGVEILRAHGVNDEIILQGVLYHHERADGSGYPHQLRAKRIPMFARIIGMCDVFDALTTHRTFRKRYSSFEALLHMKKEMASQLEVALIDAFIELHQ